VNATLAIVRKDLRRLGPAAMLWTLAQAGVTLWLRHAAWPETRPDLKAATEWMRRKESFVTASGVLMAVMLVLLAGSLVLEDRVAGSTSFWQTRPIGGRRLLGAKVLTAVLLFGVLPLAVMVPVWFGIGLTGAETAQAAWLLGSSIAVLVLGALCLAGLVRNIGELAFTALVTFALTVLGFSATGSGKVDEAGVLATKMYLGVALLLAGAAVLLLRQYANRHTERHWIAAVAGLAAVIGLQAAWRWDWIAHLPEPELHAADRTMVPELRKLVTPAEAGVPRALFLTLPAAAENGEAVGPWTGQGTLRWADGRSAAWRLTPGGLWGDEAAIRLAGVRPGSGPLPWNMALSFTAPPEGALWPRAGEARFAGEIGLARYRWQVLHRVPVRDGVTAGNGPARLRIIGWVPDAPASLLIEESDSGVRPFGARELRARDPQRRDAFLLVNERLGLVKALHPRDLGNAGFSGVRHGMRVLETSAPRGQAADWAEGAVLVQVRFERIRSFDRKLENVPLALVQEEKP
jgi:hypothetical protein